MGTNLLLIRPGIPGKRGAGSIVSLVPEDVKAIQELDNVFSAMPEVKKSVTARYGGNDQSTSLNATSGRFHWCEIGHCMRDFFSQKRMNTTMQKLPF